MARERLILEIVATGGGSARREAKQAVGGLTGVTKAAGSSAAGLGAAGRSADATGKRFSRLRSVGSRLGSGLASVAKTAGTFGLAGALVLAGGATINFDKAMRNVNSIAQLSEGALSALQRRVLALAGKTAQAPQTLAEGLYDLVSSGFDAKESLLILESSAKAATAGLTTTEVSTKAVAAVLNAYRMGAGKAKDVSDVLFRTVDRGVISFDSLAENVGDVLPFASSLGVDLRQVGASIATMTKAGISAPETMTRIKAVMVSLLKPSEDLAKVIEQQGFESGEAMIRTLGFQGTLERLSKATGGSKTELAALFPNVRALGGALALTGKNAAGAGKDVADMGKSAGSTNRALSQQSRSISYQWNQIKASVTAGAISIGSVAVPKILEFVQGMREGTGAGGSFVNIVKGVGSSASAVAGPLITGAGAVLNFAGGILQTRVGIVALSAILGGLAGYLVVLAAAWAAAKVVAFAQAIYQAVTAVKALSLATASTAIGAFAVVLGIAAGAVLGLSQETAEASVSQQQFRDSILGVQSALDRYKDSSDAVKDANLGQRSAELALKEALARRRDMQKSGTATATQLERADLDVAQAKREVERSTKTSTRAQRDESAQKKKNIADARQEIGTIRDRIRTSLRLVARLAMEGKGQREVTAAMRRAESETLQLRRAQLALAVATNAPISRIRALRAQIRDLKSKEVKVTAKVSFKVGGAIADVNPGSGPFGTGGDGTGSGPALNRIVDLGVRSLARRNAQDLFDRYGMVGGPLGMKGASGVDAFNPIAARFGLGVSSGYRAGDPGWHGQNRARDYSDGYATPGELHFAQFMAATYGSRLLELIHTPLGFGIKNGQRVAPYAEEDHYDHVHVAYRHGGRRSERATSPVVVYGEEAPRFPEYFISTNPRDRHRSLALLVQAAGDLSGTSAFKKGGKRWKRTNINVAADAYRQAGFRGKSLQRMIAISGRETGGTWDPRSHYTPSDTTEDSRGISQINIGPGANTDLAHMDLFDPYENAKAAMIVYKRAGWGAWSGNIGYDKYLEQATKALLATRGGKPGGGPGKRTPANPNEFIKRPGASGEFLKEGGKPFKGPGGGGWSGVKPTDPAETDTSAQDDRLAEIARVLEEIRDLEAQRTGSQIRTEAMLRDQGPDLHAALLALVTGGIGSRMRAGERLPSTPGKVSLIP